MKTTILSLFLCAAAAGPAMGSFILVIDLDTSGYVGQLELGMLPGATDGLDPSHDVPAPPPGPGGISAGAHFVNPGLPNLVSDYRSLADEKSWTLSVTVPAGEALVVHWSTLTPEFLATHALRFTGQGVGVDAAATNSIALTRSGSYAFEASAPEPGIGGLFLLAAALLGRGLGPRHRR